MDEQAAGAEKAVVTGSHEVVRDRVVDVIFPGAIDLGVKKTGLALWWHDEPPQRLIRCSDARDISG
jgi:hypothetical protein